MLKIDCDICDHELNEPGALLFSPPLLENLIKEPVVAKVHLCIDCFKKTLKFLQALETETKGPVS
jgi:hypothetical protein